ncbi:MAG TPA: glycosyltransferase family 87 protein [Candidatus Paceibacterota bacterium]|nr:glycosyltransferase family 87 protein [Candidatus Paceibacterota bacterium]
MASSDAANVIAEKRWAWFAGLLWLLPMLAITVMVVLQPLKRTVTPSYHDAVERWQQRKTLYDSDFTAGPQGMNYFPTFVPLFAPYHALPLRTAEVLWRWTAAAGLACGLWCFVRRNAGEFPWRSFALVSVLGLPLCLGALRNGQANAHLGATLLLAAFCLAMEYWWGAALLITLAVAIKPLGLAALGLALVSYPRLWWRLGAAILLVLALPFLTAPEAYVQGQFLIALHNLRQCSDVTQNRFADLNGLLRVFGVPLTGEFSLLVRAGAGAGLAVFCGIVVRKLPQLDRALAWLALVAAYLMIFNPMNEANSYVIFAPAAALWAWRYFQAGRRQLAWTLTIMLVTMSLMPNLLRPWLGNSFALAWHPAMTIIFLGIVFRELIQQARAMDQIWPGKN